MNRRVSAVRESQVQVRVWHIYASVGCQVYGLSQARATNQSPGLSDLYVVHTRVGAWWHEVKTEAGLREALAVRKKPKPTHVAQAEFRRLHAAIPETSTMRPVVVLGGADEAWQHLERVGLIAPNTSAFAGALFRATAEVMERQRQEVDRMLLP